MKITPLLVASTLALTAASAQADYSRFQMHPEQPYLGADVQVGRIDTGDKTTTLTSLLLRAGTNFMPYLGVEAQASYGLSNGDFKATDSNGVQYDCTAKNRGSYGIFLKPNTNLANGMNLYGLLGGNYADIQADCPAAGYAQNGYGTSFAFGAGLGFMTRETMSVNLEAMRYDTDITALNLGVRWFF